MNARTALLAAVITAAGLACDGNLDFGAGTGSGGRAGGGTCAADADCGLSVLHCDLTGSRTCVACTLDTHCTTAGARHCDPALHRCVACVLATDCAVTETCASGRCMTTCQEDTQPACPAATSCHSGVCASCGDDGVNLCAALPATPLCLVAPGICVGCRTDLDCGPSQPRCDPVNRTCAQCASGADCPSTAPVCDPRTGTCAAA